MKKSNLIKKMLTVGYDDTIYNRIDSYFEIDSTYQSIYNPYGTRTSGVKDKSDYTSIRISFPYTKGIYIFSNPNNNDEIIYIGEAHQDTIKGRLTQHFNESDGGLRKKLGSGTTNLTLLEMSNLLVLYSSSKSSKDVLFDEDLLIGLFEPRFNY